MSEGDFTEELKGKRIVVTIFAGATLVSLRGVLVNIAGVGGLFEDIGGLEMIIDQPDPRPPAMGIVNWDKVAYIEEETTMGTL